MSRQVELIKEAIEHLLGAELLEENGWSEEDLLILNKLKEENFEVEFKKD